jgi:hypothetical protein
MDKPSNVYFADLMRSWAVNFYDGGFNGPPPQDAEWTDSLGYEWWGDSPPEGWEQAVDNPRRVEIVLPLTVS